MRVKILSINEFYRSVHEEEKKKKKKKKKKG
jgi:hypothetical protein